MKSDRVRRVLTLFICWLVLGVVAMGVWQSAGVEAWASQALPPVGVPSTEEATATTYQPPVPSTEEATATTYQPNVPTTVSATAVTEPTATTIDTGADEGGLAGGYIALIVVVVVALVGLGAWVYARRRGSPKA